MTIRPKTTHEIDLMLESGRILNQILDDVYKKTTEGASLKDIDQFIYTCIEKAGAKPSFLGYHGYPASSCLSVNDVVVHGIPSPYRLKEGDMIGVDVGVIWEGYHTDAAFSKLIGSGI